MKSFLSFIIAVFCCLPDLLLADELLIRKNLQSRMPELPSIDEIRKSPVPGLFELKIGNEILYTSFDASYIIQGILFDAKTRTNLTELRKEEIAKIPFNELISANSIPYVIGNGQRKIAVFADPNCGFCKKLELELARLKDVTIYYYLYPVLGDDSFNKSGNILCSKNPLKAWHDWMISGKTPESANCNQMVVNNNISFGSKYKISGTPTMILPNGRRFVGALSAERLEQIVSANQ